MKIDIMCSCCGNHETVSNRKVSNSIDLIKRGWGSCGSALYCPECTRTWKERNSGRPMADERNTFFVILNLFMDALREADT